MSIVVPAILPSSRKDLEETLARFSAIPEIENVQIDAVDGHFAAPATWPYNAGDEFAEMRAHGEQLPYFERFRYDIDLMVTDPEQAIGIWVAMGASRLTAHVESTTYFPKVITDMREKYGHDPSFTPGLLSFGLAIGIETDLALLDPFVPYIDYVQFMGIARIGKQGQPFDERVVRKIKTFRAKHPDMMIQVDGGVNLQSAPLLLSAGANRLIVGSAILKAEDVSLELQKFEQLVK